MASKNTILEWNYLWEQVVRNFGSDRTTRQSPFVSSAQREQIYVAATGNDDTGTGRATHPYATIQKALEEVSGLEGPVTINVGPGTFNGFRIDNLRASATLKAGAYLIIKLLFQGTQSLWSRTSSRGFFDRQHGVRSLPYWHQRRRGCELHQRWLRYFDRGQRGVHEQLHGWHPSC